MQYSIKSPIPASKYQKKFGRYPQRNSNGIASQPGKIIYNLIENFLSRGSISLSGIIVRILSDNKLIIRSRI